MKKILYKQIFLTVIPILFILCGISFFTISKVSQTTENLIAETSLETAKKASNEIDTWILGLKKNVLSIADLPVVKTMKWEKMKETFIKVLYQYDELQMIFIAYPDGTAKTILRDYVSGKVSDGPTVNIFDRSYFKNILFSNSSYEISEIIISRSTNTPIFVIASAIKNDKNETVGLLGYTVLTDTLVNIAKNIKVGKTGYGWIVDQSGLVIAHPNKDIVLKMNVLESNKFGFIGLENAGKIMIEHKSGIYDIILPNKKTEKIIFTPIQLSPKWTLGIAIDKQEIYEKITPILLLLIYSFLFLLLVVIIITVIASNYIVKRINKINSIAEDLSKSDGNLTIRLTTKSADELGILSNNINKFIENIEKIVGNTKNAVSKLTIIGNDMKENAKNTNNSVQLITKNLNSIKDQIINQSSSITESLATVEEINRTTENFMKLLNNQINNISEIFATIEELVANIKSVYEVTEKNKENMNKLLIASEVGKKHLEDVVDINKKISSFSEKMNETIAILNEIVEQTDLLSINAAIEAAHAGDSGKGFAVVAEEIRKLSENAREQTKIISKSLLDVKKFIESVGSLSENAKDKYDEVMKNINNVKEQELFVENAMKEQNMGNKQLLENIRKINEITNEIKNASQEVLSGSKIILEEMHRLSDTSRQINVSSQDIVEQVKEINTSVDNVEKLSYIMNETILSVKELVDKFIVKKEGE